MQAGRELDALIAEHVMGLLPCSDPIGRCDGAKMKPCQCWGTPNVDGVVAGGDLPTYSSSIEAAWQVVEKMRGDGFNFNVHHSASQHGDPAEAYFHGYTGGHIGRICIGTGVDAPLAICLAALKAVGVEVR